MKVLVTGAAGRIGQAVIEELLPRGHTVRGIDVQEPPQGGPPPVPSDVEWRTADIRNLEEMEQFSTGVEAVIHLAAIPGPDIRTVLPAALVTTAAIPPTARLVSVGGRATASRAQAVRELQRARGPIPILLRYNEAQYFVVIRPRG